jgi:hypothetical protein
MRQPKQRLSRRAVVQTVGATVVTGTALASGTGAGAARAEAQTGITGTWLVAAEGPDLRLRRAVYIFFPGGIFQSFNAPIVPTNDPTDDPTAVNYQTVNAGQWVQTGSATYAFRAAGFNYDAVASPSGLDELTGTIVYDPASDTWQTTSRQVRGLTLDGTEQTVIARGTLRATRVSVFP